MQSKIKNLGKIFTYSKDRKSLSFALKVKAGAKVNAIEDVVCISNVWYLKLSIKTAPIHGKANKAIIEFLSEEWNLPKDFIKIKKGTTSNYKILEVPNLSFLA